MADRDAEASGGPALAAWTKSWLDKEAAGQVKPEEQAAIDHLRAAGQFPASIKRYSGDLPDPAGMSTGQRVGAFLRHTAKTGALPVLGGAAGALLGGLGGGMIGQPWLAIPGEMAGAAGGELANQALGITAPSNAQVAINAAVPGVMRSAGPASRTALSHAPGAPAVMQERAIEGMRGMASNAAGRAGALPSDIAYSLVRAAGDVPVSTRALDQTVRSIADETGRLVPSLRSPKVEALLNDLSNLRMRQPTFNDYWENVKQVGRRVREAEQSGAPEAGAYKKMFKAMKQDLEAVGGGAPSDLLKQANRIKQREWAAESLQDTVEQAVRTVGDRGLEQGNFNRVLDFIRKDKDFRSAFAAAEITDMEKTLTMLAKTPKLPPASGTHFGSGQRIAGLAAIGGAAHLLGGPEAAAGATAATGAMQKWGGPLIAKALMSDPGRKVLRNILESGAPLDATRLGALALLTRGGIQAGVQGMTAAQPGPPQFPPEAPVRQVGTPGSVDFSVYSP